MGRWPVLKTARDLCAEQILPVSEDYIRSLARQHHVGRKLGRTYVFTPADIETLIASLPCPSHSPGEKAPIVGTSVGRSEESEFSPLLCRGFARRHYPSAHI